MNIDCSESGLNVWYNSWLFNHFFRFWGIFYSLLLHCESASILLFFFLLTSARICFLNPCTLPMHKRPHEDEDDENENHVQVERHEEKEGEDGIERGIVTCTLPPSCHYTPRAFGTLGDYESHYDKYHTHLCASCRANFLTSVFLERHLEECHDPLFQAKLARGKDPVLSCFEASCPCKFKSVSARRKHLVSVHAYPPEFRFNIVQRGVHYNTQSLLYSHQPTSHKPDPTTTNREQPLVYETDARGKLQVPDERMDDLVQKLRNTKMVPSSIKFGRR